MSNESSDGKLVVLFKTVVLFLIFILLRGGGDGSH